MSLITPAQHRFAAPAGEICWFEWGAAGRGPTLLLLHATGFHARCWDQVVAALPSGLHVIAPDFRGHGRSYRPATLMDWAGTAADIAALVESEMPGPVFGVGHSMGGTVLARVAAALPDRFSRLLLVDPVIVPSEIYRDPPFARGTDPLDHPVSRRRNAWASAEAMAVQFSTRTPYSQWRHEVLTDYCRHGLVAAETEEGLELACPPFLEASAYIGAAQSDPYPLLGEITCPVTVLRARYAERASPLDFSISPTWPGLAAEFRDGRDMHWPELSHFIPMEAPERMATLIAEGMAAERS